MTIKKLLEAIDDNISVKINGRLYAGDVPEEFLVAEIVEIEIKTTASAKANLEDLGYSFEVGV